MKAYVADDQLRHDPQRFMRLGRLAKPTDLPSRAHALRDALAGLGIALEEPADVDCAPLEVDLTADRLVGGRIGALRLPTVGVQEGGDRVEAIGPALAHFVPGFLAAR